jgi:hypothetical protein
MSRLIKEARPSGDGKPGENRIPRAKEPEGGEYQGKILKGWFFCILMAIDFLGDPQKTNSLSAVWRKINKAG